MRLSAARCLLCHRCVPTLPLTRLQLQLASWLQEYVQNRQRFEFLGHSLEDRFHDRLTKTQDHVAAPGASNDQQQSYRNQLDTL